MARLDVRLHDELRKLVDEQAARLGLTKSAFVREALVAYLAWHQALDAAEDHTGQDLGDLRDPATIARLLGD
jgi:predicted transcriptional regulator